MTHPRYPLESLFGRVLSPLERFLQRSTAGGMVLVATTVLSLVLATVLGGQNLHHFWEQSLSVSFGQTFNLSLSLHHWVNDGLMAVFFLIVGLELKREILVGELSSWRDAALPDHNFGFFTIYVLGPITGASLAAGMFVYLVEPLMRGKGKGSGACGCV